MSPEQLFRCSVQSGLANMSWDEFSGTVVSAGSGPPDSTSQIRSPFTGVGSYLDGAVAKSGVQYSPTTGTILVLNFAERIQLTEEYYSPWLTWKPQFTNDAKSPEQSLQRLV